MCKTSRGGGGGGSERPHASDLFSYGVCARGRHDTNGGPVGTATSSHSRRPERARRPGGGGAWLGN